MKQQLTTLADYHVWACEILYGALLPVSDEQYRADCGLFFRSIHGTLNHLLLSDKLWFGRFSGEPFAAAGLDEELEPDRAALEDALYEQAARWRGWIEAQTDAALAGDMCYRNLAGVEYVNPTALTLMHVFNHATHHRGQVSAAITGFGHAAPAMDLIWYIRDAGEPPATA
ncbi:MAG: DinB family protein [Gammaproteobacteria bacterium]